MKILYNEVRDTILDIKACKRNDVYLFGEDNAFPSLLEALINMSVTAKACTNKGAKAIYGNAFGEAGDVIVNSDGETLNEVFRIVCGQYERHNNAYIHITYDANLDRKTLKAIPVTDPRIGKADDKNYSGKIVIYDNWQKQKNKQFKLDEAISYDRYNPNKGIIAAQIKASGKGKKEGTLNDYKGQILHVKKESTYRYAMPKLMPVLSECMLESNAQIFRSVGAKDGFLNVKLAILPPFKDNDRRENFIEEIRNVKGAKKSNAVIAIELEQDKDDVSKQVYLDDLTAPYDDTLLGNSEDRAKQNICIAQDVPYVLIGKSDNTVFGESGAMILQAQLQLWNDRLEERNQLEEVFNMLAKDFSTDIALPLIVGNPYEQKVIEPTETQTT